MTELARTAAADSPAAIAGPLLEVSGLTVGLPTAGGLAVAVNDVSFAVDAGEVKGVVGESGSGKTMLCRAILGLIPWPGAVQSGQIRWRGKEIAAARPAELRAIRGSEISMIFQDPTSALDPVFTIGEQISEPLRAHRGLTRGQARTEAIDLLGRVGIPSPKERFGAYPHQLSGGMRQRAMIAIAISCQPALILADEPTTNLDVTIQDQILRLLADLRDELGMAMILVSHDLGVVSQNADAVMVMYAGSIVETAATRTIFDRTRHPYTRGLIESLPSIVPSELREPLVPIAGQPPRLDALPPGCPFAPRCSFRRDACAEVDMALVEAAPGHLTACPFSEPAPDEEARPR